MTSGYKSFAVVFGSLLALVHGPSQAQGNGPPISGSVEGIVNLSASASIDVTRDVLNVVMTATRDGADAGVVQTQLKQALDAALVEAKKSARPGQLDVQTGNFSLFPRYAEKGGINGWQGTAELVIEGKDMQAIGALTGRLPTMTIARVAYNLSRQVRERVEGEVAAQAIARYRTKAAEVTKQFGYNGYVVREVNVSTSEPGNGPIPMLRMSVAKAASDSLPVEAGKGSVTVSVNGTVQMH